MITFYHLFPEGPAPRRADATLFGTVPLRAHAFCEPFTAGSAFGWYVFPPIDFSLRWNGRHVLWARGTGEHETWARVTSVVLPEYAAALTAAAPVAYHKFAQLPFLGCGLETDIVQIWTGLLMRTRPDWHALIRPPANLPQDPAYAVLDGVIESDWWLGPAVSPIRLYHSDTPIHFFRHVPLFQVQPVPREARSDATLDAFSVVGGAEAMGEADWAQFDASLDLRNAEGARRGAYKVAARTRRHAVEPRPS